MTLDEWRALRRQTKVTNRDEEPDVLAPPEAFSARGADARLRDEYLPGHDPSAIRARSSTVDGRINSSCCGWATQPTSAEFYDAIQAEMPTKRQRALIRMWTKEARTDEIVLAWAEEVYTVRELVAAIHRAKADHPVVARELNRLARR
ncbi:MAG: hypothetical protein F4137_25390 [Acidobacteria bacterium]|nr:hypothetical protein [Acidobacteriota bacterium]